MIIKHQHWEIAPTLRPEKAKGKAITKIQKESLSYKGGLPNRNSFSKLMQPLPIWGLRGRELGKYYYNLTLFLPLSFFQGLSLFKSTSNSEGKKTWLMSFIKRPASKYTRQLERMVERVSRSTKKNSPALSIEVQILPEAFEGNIWAVPWKISRSLSNGGVMTF